MDLDTVILSIHKDFIEVEVKNNDGEKEVLRDKNDLTLEKMLEDVKYNDYWKFYQSKGGKESRDVILEDKMAFMPFAYAYYFLLTTMHCVPTIDELCDFYIDTFCIEEKEGLYSFKEKFVFYGKKNHLFKKQDLEAKICRAYNSYVRETALLNMFFDLQKERRYQNLEIFYDFHEDLNGTDIIVKNKDKIIGLLITQSSKNSNNYNDKKRDHRHKYNYDDYIYVKVGEDRTFNCGDSKLFTKDVARNILDKCLKIA